MQRSRHNDEQAILLGLGANIPSIHGPPVATLQYALAVLPEFAIEPVQISLFYRTPPDPPSPQPFYINAVAWIKSGHSMQKTLVILHAIERKLGRIRRQRNEPRILDLDLLTWGQEKTPGNWSEKTMKQTSSAQPIIPHPRFHQRSFTLMPAHDVAPQWHHPVLHCTIGELLQKLDRQKIFRQPQKITPLA